MQNMEALTFASIPDKEEILLQVLQGGLTIAFFLSTWNWIEVDVTKLAQDFKCQRKLHPNIN